MGVKRMETHVNQLKSKKAKLDPLSKKIKVITDALKDPACELNDKSSGYRDCLISAVPFALGHGASVDERHDYQETLISILFEIFQTMQSKHQLRTGEDEELKASAVAEKASLEDKFQQGVEAQSAIGAQMTTEADDLVGANKAEEQAKAEHAKPKEEALKAQSVLSTKVAERNEVISVLSDDFKSLKEGSWQCQTLTPDQQKQCAAKLSAVLQRLAFDRSLCNTVPLVFAKAPQDRGRFDIIVQDQVETALKDRLSQLNGSEMTDVEEYAKSAGQIEAAAWAVLEAAQAKTAQRKEQLRSLELAKEQQVVLNEETQNASKRQEEIIKELEIKSFYHQAALEHCQDVISTLHELQNRKAPVASVCQKTAEESADCTPGKDPVNPDSLESNVCF